MPDGPEREALFLQANKIAIADAPYRPIAHSISTDLWYSWVIGYRHPTFWFRWWDMVDVDTELRARMNR
jgi:hypothetical protein